MKAQTQTEDIIWLKKWLQLPLTKFLQREKRAVKRMKIDKSLLEHLQHREPEEQPDNVRIYIPMDLNQEAILRRLDRVLPI